jgi:hypothetical protein
MIPNIPNYLTPPSRDPDIPPKEKARKYPALFEKKVSLPY